MGESSAPVSRNGTYIWQTIAVVSAGVATAALVGIYKMDERLVVVETNQRIVMRELDKAMEQLERHLEEPRSTLPLWIPKPDSGP